MKRRGVGWDGRRGRKRGRRHRRRLMGRETCVPVWGGACYVHFLEAGHRNTPSHLSCRMKGEYSNLVGCHCINIEAYIPH